ncbi:bifunctional glutamate N-acetyltransferase/amino-acid acetyltransferase ArgJ [Streptomyces libani]|uniref:Arginine biosynthesis bifunctional protein ArgJ n=1 Tax=Streptomyces nigrescens TaxID=1920 RepID=A0A640TNZ9_STRNI|nr:MULTISPECIES: bifunctional glutamate N-acetyltransferase/amino-acid acetyltransferase ArgJ [Streptomyces]MCX5446308.1 bifunctional glutamate N-acetyltransferase/amino-acid acetyltransferase ArgJ [Streptomyces libani]MYX08551.1 bifunctional glutamate N-acetyltransferase/amino-acid acetyltransferase ArgJ [Streptomyces sp. SID8375]WAU00354.1 bifunctional glutamate N-acetyltransferase/amino-acid acetyltransferase ArgJ [Streptomyces libani subsp. libani]WDT53844.1 bifunctional glutamate N-acetylt
MTDSNTYEPRGFAVHTAPVGLGDDGRDDFTVLLSTAPATVSAVFTRSRFAGPSVVLSRAAAADHRARGVVVLARNANVATGAEGERNAREVRAAVAQAAGLPEEELLIASTGVIGRQYPMPALRDHLKTLTVPLPDGGFDRAARAIMTTDTRPKQACRRVGDAVVAGIAKGVGMMEPDMATLLTFFATDARLDPAEQDRIFRRVMDRTFNAVSIDTDTSTSDTAALFANGLAGEVDPAAFEEALYEVALTLVKDIARDGEGAGKLIEVRVRGARDDAQAKRVGKAVVNSPLVKTAVHGGDPNWGRVAMAIGKCSDDTDIEQDRVVIRFGEVAVYPPGLPGARSEEEVRDAVAAELAGSEVVIGIDLGIADGAFTVYGCDLTEGYIRLNADYST